MTDGRSWVDVQDEPCPECRFDPGSIGVAELAEAVRSLGRKYRAPLSRFLPGEDGVAIVQTRPEPDVWSPLEYACHVRDVLGLFTARVQRTLVEDDPELGWWDHEAAVEDEGYNHQDPAAVAEDLAVRAEGLADVLAAVPPDGWDRPARRRDDRFTVAALGRYALHEGHHHLLDVGRGLRAARGR